MATNKEVAEAFVKGQEAQSENMLSTGGQLYSYRLQIAHWAFDKHNEDRFGMFIELDYSERRRHTVTTQRHMRELEAAIRDG